MKTKSTTAAMIRTTRDVIADIEKFRAMKIAEHEARENSSVDVYYWKTISQSMIIQHLLYAAGVKLG